MRRAPPRTFRLKPGTTLRLVARRLGGKPVLEDPEAAKKRKEKQQQEQARKNQPGSKQSASVPKPPGASGSASAKRPDAPAAEPVKKTTGASAAGNSSSSEGGCALVVVGALVLGLLLYTQNTGFSSALSQYLNDPASKADVGDCLLYGSWQKDDKPRREWVEVPCWSAAATYKVTSRFHGPAGTGTTTGGTGSGSTGTSAGTGLGSPAPLGCPPSAQPVVLSSVTLCATREADK